MNLLNSFSFELPTTIEYGIGAAKSLADVIKNENFRNLLLVTDEGVLRSGLLKRVSDALDAHGLKWDVFDRVEPNPKDYNVEAGTETAKRFSADCLETLEEVAMENRDVFLEAGGEHYGYIPCLNDHASHVGLFASLVGQHLQGWTQIRT